MNNDTRELLGMLVIVTIVIAGVQWLFVRFTHWSVALAVTGLIALFISSIYVSLKHATPNGGSNGPDGSEYITPMIVVFSALLLGLWTVCYLTKQQLPKMVFMIPLCFIIVFLSVRYVYEYVYNVSMYYELFSNCEIEVQDKTGGESNIREIYFQDSSSLISTVELNPTDKSETRIVRSANSIHFRYLTKKTNRLIEQGFPFDYSLCKEEKQGSAGICFWVHPRVTLPMKIILLPNNAVDLLIGNVVVNYQLNK
ncbi:hypothetical protein [Flavobacterium piscis]|uniref:Uncharacterized protein n=1 Tax=Flavobacterium piscis TaxID=1114874 RepID=A0ABU1YCU2_9FLAO|nr:hypothetical protein [Flavobacterium piscis]MDR7212060.1 hypothetical protein [Flavobacterium piscis]